MATINKVKIRKVVPADKWKTNPFAVSYRKKNQARALVNRLNKK